MRSSDRSVAGFDPLVHWTGTYDLRRALKRVLLGQTNVVTEWRYRRQARRLPDGRPGSLLPGATVLGCSRAENGVGESCRLAADALAEAGVPFGVVNLAVSTHCRQGDRRTERYEIPFPSHRVNLHHLNAPELRWMGGILGSRGLAGRVNVGIWHWELPHLPEDWKPALGQLDELWAPSRFIAQIMRAAGKREVVLMPHGVSVPAVTPSPRRELEIADDSPLFYFMFDVASYQERKNPEGVIRAFQKAFTPGSSATLLVKLNNVAFRPDKADALEALAAGWPNIRFLKKVLDRTEVMALVQACDCFVSLHRSEGFGLGPAEALALGKAVIATDWSGTTDFVHREHACPVGYRMVKVGTAAGPYEAWQEWAEPDLDEAAEWMRRLAREPALARALGRKAAAFMADEYSPRRAGERMRQRLAELGAFDPA